MTEAATAEILQLEERRWAAMIAKELEEAKHLRQEAETVLADYRRKQGDAAKEVEAIIRLAAKEAEDGVAQWLAVQSKSLREAYREQDKERITRIQKGLEAELLRIAETALRGPDGKPSADGLADLLWAVLMTPEFQLIR